MADEEDLAELFGGSSESKAGSDGDDWVPEGLRELARVESNYDDNNRLNPRIRVNKYHSDHHRDLETGNGREKLAGYLWEGLRDDYDIYEILDLQEFLLDDSAEKVK